MGFLCHFRGGGESSSDGPHRFVSDRHIGPFLLAKNIRQGLHLTSADIHGRASLTLLLLFTNTEHDLKSFSKRQLGLLGNKLTVLTSHTESLTTFRMSQDDPGNTHILELTRASLASVSTSSSQTAVLGGNCNILPQSHQTQGNVNEGSTDDNLGISGDGSGGVEVGNDLFGGGEGSVGLPVAAEKVGAAAVGCGGSFGGGFGAVVRVCHFGFDSMCVGFDRSEL
mmetsp:Transcript_31030/g.65510  ORF Transcript_31030/g.65510 Transcript_31030/m.65510 type:complete len:225 (-) Transcript_31030:51-725(-)